MGWNINCYKCGENTSYAQNIVDLIDNHTDSSFSNGGFIKCSYCGSKAYIHEPRKLQEGGKWDRHILAVIRVASSEGFGFLKHYAYLSSNTKNGEIDGVEISYYKDLRKEKGRLKHGHGPGGPASLTKIEFLSFLRELSKIGWQ